jgi:hypothetical protein
MPWKTKTNWTSLMIHICCLILVMGSKQLEVVWGNGRAVHALKIAQVVTANFGSSFITASRLITSLDLNSRCGQPSFQVLPQTIPSRREYHSKYHDIVTLISIAIPKVYRTVAASEFGALAHGASHERSCNLIVGIED